MLLNKGPTYTIINLISIQFQSTARSSFHQSKIVAKYTHINLKIIIHQLLAISNQNKVGK